MIYFRKGKFIEDKIDLDLNQPAFRTGYGFFETICWNGRKSCHLDLHLERARRSLAEFNVTEQAVDYESIIRDVIAANRLTDRFARVNIFYPVEEGRALPVICAVPFEYVPEREWKLCAAGNIFLSDLMRHKTMNRMSYLIAWQKAHDKGFDDALLLDFEGRVLESSFASLLFRKGDVFFEPETDFKLPGTAQLVASAILKIEPAVIKQDLIADYEEIFALNSLGGMIPVAAINGNDFVCNHDVALKMTQRILELD